MGKKQILKMDTHYLRIRGIFDTRILVGADTDIIVSVLVDTRTR